MMHHKERMIAALKCRQPEGAVPIWELEFQAWDNVSGKHLVLGTEFAALSQKEQELAIHNNAELMISVAKDMNYSALTEINRYWEIAPGKPSYYWLPAEARLEQNKLLQKYCDREGIMLVAICSANITMPGSSDSYEEFCYKIFDEPEEIDEMARVKFEAGMEITRQYADRGYSCIMSPSDIADSRGCFFSPPQMERWFYPYLREWAQEVRRLGMYSILHTDGNLDSELEKLASSGIHAIQAVDPLAGMDIKKVKEKVGGRLCLCGNVKNSLLVMGPKEEVFENTRQILEDCKEGGGLIIGGSNAVEPSTPAENYREMIRAWEVYGRY